MVRSRYRTFLPIAVQKLQTEVIRKMEKTLWKDSTEHNVFLNEPGMFEGEAEECRISTDMTKYTVMAPYPSHNIQYIVLKSETVQK